MMVEVFMTMLAIVFCIPAVVLFVQVLSACFLKRKAAVAPNAHVKTAVLIPAHNESAGMIATLESVKPQLSEHDRLLVVADNCTDDTAAVARAHGVEVIERADDLRRGKGYALDFGIQHLKQSPTDVLVIVDADCVVEAGGIKQLATAAYQQGKPVQALYLMYSQNKQDLKSCVAEFAWCVKNLVRPLGFANLGQPCQLMGTGMAFPWADIARIDLANGNIVEDMKLGIDFALNGKAPMFYPAAKVTSLFPLTSETQQGQSKRWEHGHLSMILSEAPKLIGQGFKEANLKMMSLGLDLSIPPLALFVLLLVSFSGLATVMHHFFGVAAFAYQLGLVNLLLLVIAILLAWWHFGREIISVKNMLYIPVYILQKIPNHLSFIFKRQSAWNKTKREQE